MFSSKKTVYSVELSTSRLLEKPPQNYFVGNIVKSILDSGDLTYTVLKSFATGPSSNVRRYYDYGKNYYYYKLPSVETSFNFLDYEALKKVIEEEVYGGPVTISDAYYGPLISDVWAKIYLYRNYNMNPSTGVINIGSYIWSPQYVFSSISADGRVITLRSLAAEYSDYSSTATYSYYRIYNVPLAPSGEWYIAFYQPIGSTGFHYFEYRVNSGRYELLDNSAISIQENVLPIVTIRNSNQTLTTSHPAYPTTKKLLKKINIGISDLIKGINSTSDLDKINNVFFLFSINLRTNKALAKEYLYYFFKSLSVFLKTEVTTEQQDRYSEISYAVVNSLNLEANRTGLYFVVNEQNYTYELSLENIEVTTAYGYIGKPKTTTISINTASTYNYSTQTSAPANSIIIKHQINNNYYEVLTITGAKLINKIPQTNFALQTKEIKLDDVDNFIIPFIPELIWENFNLKDQETVIYEAMQVVVYAAMQQTVKSGGLFGSFFGFILSIAIAFFAPYIMTGVFPSIGQVVTRVLINAAINLVIENVLGPLLGKNIAFLALAIGAVNFGANMLFGGGSLSFSDILLKSVEAITKAITINTQVILEQGYEELRELADLTKSVEEQTEEVKDLMNDRMGLVDPFMLVTKPRDRYWRNSSGFIANSLKTPLDLVQDSKNGPKQYVESNLNCWNNETTTFL